MQKLIKSIIVFGIGSFLYGGIEIAFRGFTHWSMFIAGGLIFLILYKFFGYIGKGRILLKCVFGSVIITTVEFLVGVCTNILLNLDVWDYSSIPYNLYGQICVLFSVGWFFISIPASILIDGIRRQFNRIF